MIFAEIASDYPPKIMPIGHSVRFVGLIISPFARYLLDTPAVHWTVRTGLHLLAYWTLGWTHRRTCHVFWLSI